MAINKNGGTLSGADLVVIPIIGGTSYNPLTFTTGTPSATPVWATATSEFSVPAGTTSLSLEIQAAPGVSQMRVDDILLVEGGSGSLIQLPGVVFDPSTMAISGSFVLNQAFTSNEKITVPYNYATGETANIVLIPTGGGFPLAPITLPAQTLVTGSETLTIPLTAVGTPTATGALSFDVQINGTSIGTVSTTVEATQTEQVIYTTGFEAPDFVAGTTYNNATPATSGPTGQQWLTYYGMPTNTSSLIISGSQSMHMRWYTTAAANFGYTQTNFALANVTKVTFSAKAGVSSATVISAAVINVNVQYSTDGGVTWLSPAGASNPTLPIVLSTTAASYTISLNNGTAVTSAQIRFTLGWTNAPTANTGIVIDDVSIYGMQ